MIWLLKFLITWLSIDVVVIATGWYINTVARVYFPNWWKQVICDDLPATSLEFARDCPISSKNAISAISLISQEE